MNYNFVASAADKIILFDFIFNGTDLRVFDLSSLYGQKIVEYKSSEEIASKFDLENGEQYSVTFQLWAKRFEGEILFRKLDLNPKYCDGYTFRYSTEGWGLIQLYFGGQNGTTLFHSHIGHFSEKKALKWEDANHFNGKADRWNWKQILQTSGELRHRIHDKMASRKAGSYGVLPGADRLSNNGIELKW